jgi:hypothetical protein
MVSIHPYQQLHQRRERYFALAARLLLAVLLLARPSSAAEPAGPKNMISASEYDLKLARLYSTLRYITWPDEAADPHSPLVIGVIEPNPFGARLAKLNDRMSKNRPIQVHSIKVPSDYRPCHLLFISADAPTQVTQTILEKIADHPVLVWRDQPAKEAVPGVAFTFLLQGGTLLIEADPSELKRRKLAPEGQLLSLNIVRLVKNNK